MYSQPVYRHLELERRFSRFRCFMVHYDCWRNSRTNKRHVWHLYNITAVNQPWRVLTLLLSLNREFELLAFSKIPLSLFTKLVYAPVAIDLVHIVDKIKYTFIDRDIIMSMLLILAFICCNSMRYCCVEVNLYMFFYRLLIYVLQLGSSFVILYTYVLQLGSIFVILYTYVFLWFIEK